MRTLTNPKDVAPHHTAHVLSAGSNNVKLQQRQLVEWKKNCILVPEVSVPEVSLPAEVTLKKIGAAVAYNQIMSSLVDNRMDMNDVAPFDDEILIAANRLELGEHGSCHHNWCHGSQAASPICDLASIEGAPSNGHCEETEYFRSLCLAMGQICTIDNYKSGTCCNPPGFNKKHPASDSKQCLVPGIRDDEASFSFSPAVEPPRNQALDYVWKERKGEKLGACTKIFARRNSVLLSCCLIAAAFKEDNILAHHTNRHVVLSIVRRTTPIVATSSAASSSSTLSGTKFGTIVVAETTSWMEAFRSIQQEINLVLVLPIVVMCFGATVIASSLASMRCCAVEKKKKKGTYFFWPIFFAPTFLIALFYFFDIV